MIDQTIPVWSDLPTHFPQPNIHVRTCICDDAMQNNYNKMPSADNVIALCYRLEINVFKNIVTREASS